MAYKESEIKFVKMHGAGNDYVYIDATHTPPVTSSNYSQLAIDISDRNFGVGGDGLVIIMHSDVADFRMRMFNADGSEAQMCGNASRCVGKYIYDNNLSSKRIISLETLAGIKILHLHIGDDNRVESVTVDMGSPILSPEDIPVQPDAVMSTKGYPFVEMHYEVNSTIDDISDSQFEAIPVSMGNPHAVIFIDTPPTDFHINSIGRRFETHPAWPEKVNVEFAHILSPELVEMRVWERGSGETLACGTGACATLVAGCISGRLSRKATVSLPGGNLLIEWNPEDHHVYMTGPAVTVARGVYFWRPPQST